MASKILDIADQLLALLQSGTYAVSFTPTRGYLSVQMLKGLTAGDVRVVVVPAQAIDDGGDRSRRYFALGLQIMVVSRVDASGTDAVDALVDLEHDIAEAVWSGRAEIGGSVQRVSFGGSSGELFDRPALYESGVFIASVDIEVHDYGD